MYVTGRSSGTPTYATGGTIEETAALVDQRGGQGIPVRCDHTNDEDVRALFDRIRDQHGRLDILVNNVWGGYGGWHEKRFAQMLAPFLDQPFDLYDAAMTAGVRAHFTASALAVPLMGADSLIATISFFAELAAHYDVTDINGSRPASRRPEHERDMIPPVTWPPA
ncbi:MAG TPA: SDR family oxidoreductase [Pseudonocardiaceae bacterium]|nr:SDR family oxidoreductase [Pseudonocardiaceae bacterium]